MKEINHGTSGGARAHRARGEDPCFACRLAAAAYMKRWREVNRKGHNRELEAQRARGYAISELLLRHQDELSGFAD